MNNLGGHQQTVPAIFLKPMMHLNLLVAVCPNHSVTREISLRHFRYWHGRYNKTCKQCCRKASAWFKQRNQELDQLYYKLNNERSKARRERVINRYGGICACCGEAEMRFLVIDHINGGGNKHRREIGAVGGRALTRWLEKTGYPDGFQVLCHNCNFAKSNGGCPHEIRRKMEGSVNAA